MHLLKGSISRETKINRGQWQKALWNYQVCTEKEASDSMPAVRSKTDSVRTAARYVLLSYQRFEHNGRQCTILAKSPKNAKKRGLDIQLNVQAIGDDTVEYSEQIARLYAPNAQSTPELIRQPAAQDFERLCSALAIDRLIADGQSTLYANDVRRMLETILERYTVRLWTGLSLVLDDTGMDAIKRLQDLCDQEMTIGSVTLSTLALDMSSANRDALGRELAQELNGQLDKLCERCAYTAPNAPAILADYEILASKISQAESILGVTIPCQQSQLALETALMALD